MRTRATGLLKCLNVLYAKDQNNRINGFFCRVFRLQNTSCSPLHHPRRMLNTKYQNRYLSSLFQNIFVSIYPYRR